MNLEPCPFCENKGEVKVCQSIVGPLVKCDCGAEGPSGNTVEEAVDRWNRRPALAAAVEHDGPEWACSDCGSTTSFTGVHHANSGDFDMKCNECDSMEVEESPREALSRMAKKISVVDELKSAVREYFEAQADHRVAVVSHMVSGPSGYTGPSKDQTRPRKIAAEKALRKLAGCEQEFGDNSTPAKEGDQHA